MGHTNYVYSLAFSPDGASLVSGSGDGTVRIWDTEPSARRQQARREEAQLEKDGCEFAIDLPVVARREQAAVLSQDRARLLRNARAVGFIDDRGESPVEIEKK